MEIAAIAFRAVLVLSLRNTPRRFLRKRLPEFSVFLDESAKVVVLALLKRSEMLLDAFQHTWPDKTGLVSRWLGKEKR